MVKESNEGEKARAKKIARVLDELYPLPDVPIKHRDVQQLLVAAILSAQTTDAQVNEVTPELFARFPNLKSLASAKPAEVENIIRPVGLHRTKARKLIAAARIVIERFAGGVPDTREELMQLPGVGRKVANVVLAYGFGKPGFPVDTHVKRLSKRLGLSQHTDPAKIEHALCNLFPPQKWGKVSLQLIHHGRRICDAKRPRCKLCALADLCPSAER